MRWITALVLVLLATLGACSKTSAPGSGAATSETAHDPAQAASRAPAAEMPPTPAPNDDPCAGTWWALAPSHPYRALRVSLVDTVDSDRLEGYWISFDWRTTSQADALVRRSKPVRVVAQRQGSFKLPRGLVLDGPMPMLDENGQPNGQNGAWHLDVSVANLPGEPLRFHGTAHHTTLTGEEGVAVDLVRDFRPWSP